MLTSDFSRVEGLSRGRTFDDSQSFGSVRYKFLDAGMGFGFLRRLALRSGVVRNASHIVVEKVVTDFLPHVAEYICLPLTKLTSPAFVLRRGRT